SQSGLNPCYSGGLVRGIGQETLGVEPAGSHPWRREPTVHGEHRGSYELGRVDLVDLGIPIRIAGGPIRMALCKAAARRDLEVADWRFADREARHGGGREVGVMKIIAVERRDRIGMRNEIALRRKGTHDRPDEGAGGSVVARMRGAWVDGHDDERAERFDGVQIDRWRARKAQARAEIGLDLAVAQWLRRLLGSERLDFDLVGIKRGIDWKLVPAPRHGDEGRAKDEDGCSKPFHVAEPSPAGESRKRAGQTRSHPRSV